MVRGEAEYLLSDKATVELFHVNPNHPQIKRASAAKLALAEILYQFTLSPDVACLTPTKPPLYERTCDPLQQDFPSG